jgi:hypothetical protein
MTKVHGWRISFTRYAWIVLNLNIFIHPYLRSLSIIYRPFEPQMRCWHYEAVHSMACWCAIDQHSVPGRPAPLCFALRSTEVNVSILALVFVGRYLEEHRPIDHPIYTHVCMTLCQHSWFLI